MAPGAQVDYDALIAKHGGTTAPSTSGVGYDSLISRHGGTVSADPDAYWNDLKAKYGLPSTVDLSKPYYKQDYRLMATIDPDAFTQAYQEANAGNTPQGFLANAWDEAKNIVKGAFSEGTGVASMPPVPG